MLARSWLDSSLIIYFYYWTQTRSFAVNAAGAKRSLLRRSWEI